MKRSLRATSLIFSAVSLCVLPWVTADVSSAAPYNAPLQPGKEILTSDDSGSVASCTAGFMVLTSDPTPAFLTAGHCTPTANRSFYMNTGSGAEYAGNSRVVTFDGLSTEVSYVGTTDIALIDASYSPLPLSPRLVNGMSVTKVSTAQELLQGKPQLCHIGAVSGPSCGPMISLIEGHTVLFSALGAHGDSGGPVVAVWPNGVVTAAGVLSGILTSSNESGSPRLSAQLIAPWMDAWGLTLANDWRS